MALQARKRLLWRFFLDVARKIGPALDAAARGNQNDQVVQWSKPMSVRSVATTWAVCTDSVAIVRLFDCLDLYWIRELAFRWRGSASNRPPGRLTGLVLELHHISFRRAARIGIGSNRLNARGLGRRLFLCIVLIAVLICFTET